MIYTLPFLLTDEHPSHSFFTALRTLNPRAIAKRKVAARTEITCNEVVAGLARLPNIILTRLLNA